jgi:predicted PurR-regulated permease PerM
MGTALQDSDGPVAEPASIPPGLPADPAQFQRQLTIATLGLLFVVLVIYILERCESILQPLFIACFVSYIIIPFHMRLVRLGVPSKLAYVVILAVTLGLFIGVGRLVYNNLNDLDEGRLEVYEQRLDQLSQRCLAAIGIQSSDPGSFRLRHLLIAEGKLNTRVRQALLAVTGSFLGFLTAACVVFIYLIFLLAEGAGLPNRLTRAFGQARAEHILSVKVSIHQAISEYIRLKTFVSFLQGGLSMLVLGLFGVDFFVMWGMLIFLFNFIPYVGSLLAVSLPILLSFILYADEPWKPVVITVLLLGIQRVIDNYVEPRLTGRRLDISPLLVLLSLAFWGWLWGVVGMILAVPLTVSAKIILANIRETKPIATLLSGD